MTEILVQCKLPLLIHKGNIRVLRFEYKIHLTAPGDTDSVDFRQKPSVYGVQRNLLIQLESNGDDHCVA